MKPHRCAICEVDFFAVGSACPRCKKPSLALMTIHLHVPSGMACGEDRGFDQNATGDVCAVTCPACTTTPEYDTAVAELDRRKPPAFVWYGGSE